MIFQMGTTGLIPSTPPVNWDTEIFEGPPYRWKSNPSTVSGATRGGSKGNFTLKAVLLHSIASLKRD